MPSAMNRRQFVKAAVAAAPASCLPSAGTTVYPPWPQSQAGAPGSEPLRCPPELRSSHRVLQATIRAAPGDVHLGPTAFAGLLYNGRYIPPTLRARVGDVLRITFCNDLAAKADGGKFLGPICAGTGTSSNMHFHGLSVSPRGNSDNVFVHVQPGETFEYQVRIPANGRQGPGLFWYHPHAHGTVNDQIMAGMSGALVIDGSEQLLPLLADMPERFFLIKHAKAPDGTELVSINGQLNPLVEMRSGEMQLWRIANIGASNFYKIGISGMPLYIVATDGHMLSRPRKAAELFVGPGERVDAIAIGPPAGTYPLKTIPFRNEAWRAEEPSIPLAVVWSTGPARTTSVEAVVLTQRIPDGGRIEEVRRADIAQHRTLLYSRTADRSAFLINGKVTDEARTDQTVRLGDTEEWTVVNTDQQYHSFHIHQTPFLVTQVGSETWYDDSLRDTFSVPPATPEGPGVLKVKIPFTDPEIIGRFVYHCHAVDHEDKGMMGVIEVRE
ncbi:multicopper oxidase domain-containing protein [Bradyrhizobium liaoningense]|nr:multicopper oxidase domain-containing protein [Bradyrhizobium liaoningense]